MEKMFDFMTLEERVKALEQEVNGEKLQREMMRKVEAYKDAYDELLHGNVVKDSLKIGADKDGGYLVPDEFEHKLIKALNDQNILRKLGTVITTDHLLRIPGVSAHGTAEWIDEGKPIPESDVTFYQVMLDAHKVGTAIRVSDELLEDSGFDIEKYIADEFGRRIGEAEEKAFLSGDGNGKPVGFLSEAEIGVETDVVDIDAAIDLYHSVSRYRENATWLMSNDAYQTLRKVKTANGINIWQPSMVEGEPDTLLGRPVYISEAMPETSAGACVVAFGDFSYLWVADRGNRSLKQLKELYATTGQVGFLASQRVDARLTLREAIKTMKIAA